MTRLHLQKFIETHYVDENDKTEILEILTDFNLVDLVDNEFNGFNKKDSHKTLNKIAKQLLIKINVQMPKYKEEPQTKLKIERILGKLAINILMDLLKNIENPLEYLQELKAVLIETCKEWEWNYDDLKERFNFENVALGLSLKGGLSNNFKEIKRKGKKTGWLWTEKGNLEKLNSILLDKQYIISKKDFCKLFNPPDTLKVKWNSNKKEYLAHLIYTLVNKDYIRLLGNRGYFSFAQKYIVDSNNNYFSKNYLKNTSSNINSSLDKYELIIKEIDNIILQITNI